MVTSKIIQILRKLNRNDLLRFRDFLASPYFNHKNKLVQFYDKLVKYAPEFDEGKIDKESIYKHLYPESRFNAQVYKNLSSELYSLAREFISVSFYRTNEYEQGINLLEKLESYGADELYKSELKNLRKKLNKNKYNDIHFFHKFKIALIERNFLYHRSKRAILYKSGYEESNELMKYYFVHAFRQRFDFESLELNFNIMDKENSAMIHIRKQLETGLVQDTINHMKAAKSRDYEVVSIFYYILMSFKYPDNDFYFNSAKELVFKNINKFDKSAQFEVSDAIYGLFSFRMMHNPSLENYRDTFDIINFRLKRKIYKENGKSYFDAISFRAIFLTGVRLGEYGWLKRFLKKYIRDVKPEDRENLFNLLTSFNKFFEKKYDESLKSLNKVKYDINLYKLDVRKLQLLNYYELSHIESAISLIASFKEFLNTNKDITKDEKTKNLKLVSTFSRLVKLKNEYNEFNIIKLENDIKKDAEVLYRNWFLEKIKELKSENKK
jgi:hypothetical protein